MSKQHVIDSTADSAPGRAAGAELASPDKPDASKIDSVLARNRTFAAAGGHEGAVVFPKLRLFVITCLDPRVDPAHFLGLELSDAIVARNVGGRVTREVINDIAFIAQLAENVLADGPLSRSRSSTTPSAAPARSPTPPSAAHTPNASSRTRRTCATTPSSTPRRR
jgi:hypothetical protein